MASCNPFLKQTVRETLRQLKEVKGPAAQLTPARLALHLKHFEMTECVLC